MKVLIAHNEYKISGGEETAVSNKIKILKENGIQVKVFSKNNIFINSVIKQIAVAFSSIFSFKVAKEFDRILEEYNPDIIEVHNFFPLMSPSIFYIAKKRKVPIIYYLHNYRIICGSSFLSFDNECCEKCKGNFFLSIFNRCYKRSYLGSFFLSVQNLIHSKILNTWDKKVDYFIIMNQRNIHYYTKFGIKRNKILYLPHFSFMKKSPPGSKEGFALFVGRLSKEKGILTLLKAWENINYPLKIIGELNSSDKELIERLNRENKFIEKIGHINHSELQLYYQNAEFTIFPSEWAEPFGLVIIESFANSTPVLSSNHNSLKEMIQDNYNGVFFEQSNYVDLKDKVLYLLNNQEMMKKMQLNSFDTFNNKFSPEMNIKLINKTYKFILNND
tara:strand:+ start:40971 stop:42137 length:1167 start_codon:yes stop_codon:yes gene_type:complete